MLRTYLVRLQGQVAIGTTIVSEIGCDWIPDWRLAQGTNSPLGDLKRNTLLHGSSKTKTRRLH